MRNLRGRLSFANVMSVIALFVALGGTGYAAFKLPKNSVGTKQLKKNSITSAKVKDHALRAQDFKSGQLPAGAPGAPGGRGPSDGYSTSTTNPVGFTGGEEQVLDSISLPAGKYILTGYANANNNGAIQIASCRITLGGETEIGGTSGINLGNDGEVDRQVLTVTGGGTLVASDVAALRCTAATSEGNWVRSGLTAIKVASLNGG